MDKAVFDRLLTEYKELEEKIGKLRTFLLNKNIDEKVNNLNKDLLIGQLKAMETYLTILSVRIGLNTPSDKVKESEPEVSE